MSKDLVVGVVVPVQGPPERSFAIPIPIPGSDADKAAKRQKARDIIGVISVDIADNYGWAFTPETWERWTNLVMEKL